MHHRQCIGLYSLFTTNVR